MSDITFEPEDTTFDDFSLPDLELDVPEIEVNQDDIDALVAELARDYPTSDVDVSEPEIDQQQLLDWLDSLEPSSFDMEL